MFVLCSDPNRREAVPTLDPTRTPRVRFRPPQHGRWDDRPAETALSWWPRANPTRRGNLANWNDTEFEKYLDQALKENLGNERGAEYVSLYISARQVLLKDVLEEIRGAEPDLTDHGPEHVRDVLENVFKLLKGNLDYFDPLEHYILGLSVLFHDVGNLHGRENHGKRIAQFYDHVRPSEQHAHEKALVVRIAQAHTGTARNGTSNTLADVPTELHFNGERIRARELAAVVRLADELAEGPERTSQYMRRQNLYAPDSTSFHDYSTVTAISIDRGNERIAVTYQFKILTERGIEQELAKLRRCVEVALARLAKMDVERRYARFHCPAPLAPFQKISISLDVQIDGEFVEPPMETAITDEVNPDRGSDLLLAQDASWDPDAIVSRVRQEVLQRTT